MACLQKIITHNFSPSLFKTKRSILSWQNKYSNLKTTCHIKPNFSCELREKWSFIRCVFSHIRTEYGEMRSISPYSVGMRENTGQKKLRIWTLFTQWIKLHDNLLFYEIPRFCRYAFNVHGFKGKVWGKYIFIIKIKDKCFLWWTFRYI